MQQPFYIRQQYGDNFCTFFEDGTEVPWRTLSLKDYLQYDQLIKFNIYPLAQLMDEIFRKCVLNEYLVINIDTIKAGIVDTVARNIFDYSAPTQIQDLETSINIARSVSEHVFHQMIMIICWAFPAYTPDDLYAMDFATCVDRFALAENKLFKLGLITEQFNFNNNLKQQEQPVVEEPKKPTKEDIMLKYYEQSHIKHSTNTATKKVQQPPKEKPAQPEKVVISSKDIKEHMSAYTGHEMEDHALLEHNMVEQTKGIYADYLKQLETTGKLEIKTPEQRKQEALERAKKNEALVNRAFAEKSNKEKQELETLKKEQESKKAFKKNSKNRRR